MKVLILEDEQEKYEQISKEILEFDSTIVIDHSSNKHDFTKMIERVLYDLIIIDLIVPSHKNAVPTDQGDNLALDVRDEDCKNRDTPVIALTQSTETATENYEELNRQDIVVVTYELNNEWQKILKEKLKSCLPRPNYDFLIICALCQEVKAYEKFNTLIDSDIDDLDCKGINIDDKKGLVITCSRMGLVSAAVTASIAIERFNPKLVAMSGICAGITNEVDIYDVIIPDMCYQNDSGKWTPNGFNHESYAVQLNNQVKTKIKKIIEKNSFKEDIIQEISPKRSQLPESMEILDPKIILGTTSSGSAVIADESFNTVIKGQHRKIIGFEMENYALYEAARLSGKNLIYFSAKSVVDNGNPSKDDSYHSIACELSAKVTIKIISEIL